ncbi:MAG: hypothetical protein ACI8QS_002924, partial [Planctomycetota bacterium]
MKIWMSTIVLVLLGFTPIDPAQAEEKPLSVKEKKALVAEALELGSRAMGEQRARQLEIFGRFGGEDALTSREDKKWRSYLLEVWVNLPGLPETKGDNFSWEDERKGRYIVGGKSKK